MDYSQQMAQLDSEYQRILKRKIELYRERLSKLEARYRALPPGKRRALTVPAVFDRSYDENFISDYLAYVLDPSRNGIGVEPLRALLEKSGFDASTLDFSKVEINREQALSSGGRIDLCIIIDDSFVLGIENKVLSAEGAGQTPAYARAMAVDFPGCGHHFVFLTPEGRKASSRRFVPMSYSSLVEALQAVPVRLGNDLRSYFYWEDFIVHVEEYIIMDGGQFELSEKAKLYLEHYSMINDLIGAYQDDMRGMFALLGSTVQGALGGGGWIVSFKPGRLYQQAYREAWDRPELWIHLEYAFPNDVLLSDWFALMIDVERKGRQRFTELFRQRYERARTDYEKAGIDYCPDNRRIAVAWKKYSLQIDMADLESIGSQLISALEEFAFLPALVDEALKEYLS
jgi:hypothetical protein